MDDWIVDNLLNWRDNSSRHYFFENILVNILMWSRNHPRISPFSVRLRICVSEADFGYRSWGCFLSWTIQIKALVVAVAAIWHFMVEGSIKWSDTVAGMRVIMGGGRTRTWNSSFWANAASIVQIGLILGMHRGVRFGGAIWFFLVFWEVSLDALQLGHNNGE